MKQTFFAAPNEKIATLFRKKDILYDEKEAKQDIFATLLITKDGKNVTAEGKIHATDELFRFKNLKLALAAKDRNLLFRQM